MKNDFREKVNIREIWCDAAGLLSLKGLANMLENQADRHLGTVNMSSSDFLKQNMAWVIVRREASIKRLPALGEAVEITTWSGAFRHGLCPRWYEVTDDSGEIIIDVVCHWVVIDLEHRDIIFKDNFMEFLPHSDKAEYGRSMRSGEDYPKLTHMDGLTALEEYRDKNGHVNNGYYLKWVDDIAARAVQKSRPIHFWIEYSKEIIPGDEVEIMWEKQENRMYFKGYVNGDHETVMYSADMELSAEDGTKGDTAAGGVEGKARITDETIAKLYEEYQTPEHVRKHCKGVTDCAMGIAKALNEHGHHLDLEMIYGAGMVHDMARTQEYHWTVAADKLDELGFHDEADIVRVHMEPGEYSPVERLTERDMICLGDRLVKEDQYVGIDERFEYIIDKARRYGVLNFDGIMRNKAKMQKCLDGIEAEIGCKIDDLFK